MVNRICPHCGEIMPSFSLSCPMCYRSIHPAGEGEEVESVKIPSLKTYDRRIIILLTLLPAAIGLAGMAQLYMKNYKKAGRFLFASLPTYTSMILLISSGKTFSPGHATATILTIICVVLFLTSYFMQAFDAFISSIFSVNYVKSPNF